MFAFGKFLWICNESCFPKIHHNANHLKKKYTLAQGYELANADDTCKKTSPYMFSHLLVGGGGGQNFIKGVGQEIRYFKNGLIDCGNGKKIHKNLCDIIMY